MFQKNIQPFSLMVQPSCKQSPKISIIHTWPTSNVSHGNSLNIKGCVSCSSIDWLKRSQSSYKSSQLISEVSCGSAYLWCNQMLISDWSQHCHCHSKVSINNEQQCTAFKFQSVQNIQNSKKYSANFLSPCNLVSLNLW